MCIGCQSLVDLSAFSILQLQAQIPSRPSKILRNLIDRLIETIHQSGFRIVEVNGKLKTNKI